MNRVLAEAEWRARIDRHEARVAVWIEPRLQRRAEGLRHPVDDFLWTYYRNRPAALRVWHPGLGVILRGHPPIAGLRGYRRTGVGWSVDPTGIRIDMVRQRVALLRATAARPARTNCFGMHEWAMVLGLPQSQVRHEQVPLRLADTQIEDVIDDVGLRCTHFDAYRFFTAGALTRQRPLSRAAQSENEQPGCIHAGMDLYRYSYESAPYVGSDLVADCFEHARTAREVDMRASPYDLSAWGLAPIPIETASGRREYADVQAHLARGAQGLRDQLIEALQQMADIAGSDRAESA